MSFDACGYIIRRASFSAWILTRPSLIRAQTDTQQSGHLRLGETKLMSGIVQLIPSHKFLISNSFSIRAVLKVAICSMPSIDSYPSESLPISRPE